MLEAQDQAKLKTLSDELGDDVPLLKKIVADFKAGGIKKVIADDGALLVQEAQEDFAAVTGALPVIKSGWKTTEFWLVLGVLLGNGLYTAFTGGKVLPFDLNATLAGLIAIYAVVRGLVKKTPSTPPPAPPGV